MKIIKVLPYSQYEHYFQAKAQLEHLIEPDLLKEELILLLSL